MVLSIQVFVLVEMFEKRLISTIGDIERSMNSVCRVIALEHHIIWDLHQDTTKAFSSKWYYIRQVLVVHQGG